METDVTRRCELLVGLGEVNVVGVIDRAGGPLVVKIETRGPAPGCPRCGGVADLKDRDEVTHVDVAVFGRQARLVWVKRRRRCVHSACVVGSWTETNDEIAVRDRQVTTRAARWKTLQVGAHGCTVDGVAADVGCDWHTVNDTVGEWGEALLAADAGRISELRGLGPMRRCSSARAGGGPRRGAPRSSMPAGVSSSTSWKVAAKRVLLGASLPGPHQVADPVHPAKVANQRLDEVHRRAQNQALGHRGRNDDPLYRARRLLSKADERLDERGRTKLVGLLAAGDPHGEVPMAWHSKEVIRSIYDIDDHEFAVRVVDHLATDPPRRVGATGRQLGRTIARWATRIADWHRSGLSNGPTEATNNLVKRIKRIGFRFRRFRNYRIWDLLSAGRPNWALLDTLTPAATQ